MLRIGKARPAIGANERSRMILYFIAVFLGLYEGG